MMLNYVLAKKPQSCFIILVGFLTQDLERRLRAIETGQQKIIEVVLWGIQRLIKQGTYCSQDSSYIFCCKEVKNQSAELWLLRGKSCFHKE